MKTNICYKILLVFAILLCNTLQLLASPQYFGSWVFFDGHLWEKGYNVYLCIGKENPENPMQDSVRFYQLNRVRNTQRFYSKNKSETVPEWEGASYFAMIATSSTYTKSNGENIPITLHYTYDEIISQAKHYTAKYTEDYHIDPKQSGLYYISLTQVGDNMYTMSIDKKNKSNQTQTLGMQVFYNETTCMNKIAPANIKSTGLPFDGDWNGPNYTKSRVIINKGETNIQKFGGTNSACISTLDTLACTELHDAYEFLGWWNETEQKLMSTELKYLYEVLGNTTVYARFRPKADYKHRLYLYAKRWKDDDSKDYRFAVYAYNDLGEAEWIDLEPLTCTLDDYYECYIPAKYHSLKFYKMDPTNQINDFSIALAHSADTLITLDERTCYTLGELGGDGTYNGRWIEPPTYDVKLNIQGKGSVTFNDSTYYESTIIPNVLLHTPITAITPADRWAFADDATSYIETGDYDIELQDTIHLEENIVDNKYAICGPTNINVHFVHIITEILFTTNLPDEVAPAITPQYIPYNTTASHPDVREVNGYVFEGWYKDDSYTEYFDFNTPVMEDITIYGRWVPYSECVFFKNNVYWDKVYVYTFDDNVWDEIDGVQVQNPKEFGKMTQIGKTDVFYFILRNGFDFSHIAFSDVDMSSDDNFSSSYTIYRNDHNSEMSFFIPLKGQESVIINEIKYINKGIWMKYKSQESGYFWSRRISEKEETNISFEAQYLGNYSYKAKVTLSKGEIVDFRVKNLNNDYYGCLDTMSIYNCNNKFFELESGEQYTHIAAEDVGVFYFTIYFGEGKIDLSLENPVSGSDIRIQYIDDTPESSQYSRTIKGPNGSGRDTISFFVRHDKNPKLQIYYCHWRDGRYDWKPYWNKTGKEIDIKQYCSETGVYNFVIIQSHPTAIQQRGIAEVHKYTGDYYIRSNTAEGGWTSYMHESNKMTHSQYAEDNEDYNYYFYKWVNAHEDVKYVIANDYSMNISDTLIADEIISYNYDGIDGHIPHSAHVRFAWNSHTNELGRAYIAGDENTSNRYLVLEGNDQLKNAKGDILEEGTVGNNRYGLNEHEEIFSDLGDAKYEVDVKANKNTQVKVSAKYNGKIQYFKGSPTSSISLLQGEDESDYKMRLIYDLRTNQLLTGWIPDDMILGETLNVGSNMLIVRKNNERVNQIAFKDQTIQVEAVDKVYSVMTFTKDFIKNNELPSRLRSLYWISFPFDVNLSDVFGFGDYGKHWILQYYDGAERAEKGLFIDSGTYWKYITDMNTVLQKGVGYVLALDLDEVRKCFINDVNELRLYFPSIGPMSISSVESVEVPSHQCNITNRELDHSITDSHWNLIGVPCFADINDLDVTHSINQEDITFYYEYDVANDVYTTALNQANFRTMYAYMVQFAGEIKWRSEHMGPQEIIARHAKEKPCILRLDITNNTNCDHTYIQLKEQGATMDFDMNQDLTKIINKGTNIYTLIGEDNIQAAGNVLPVEQIELPVGVQVSESGDYIFSMPNGTSDISAVLLDQQNNVYTDMLYNDYCVNLDEGIYEGRFYLILNPSKVTTRAEDIIKNDDNISNKYLIDGALFIQVNDVLYDVLGRPIH